MAEAVDDSPDEGIAVKLKRIPKELAVTEDETIELVKEEAIAEAEKRLRDLLTRTTGRSLSRVEQSTPEADQPDTGLDKHTFTQTRAMAQGFMDMALLVANAGQLRLVLTERESGNNRIFMADFVIALLVASIVVQILVGVLLYIKSRQNINNLKHHKCIDMVNNMTTGLVMIITVLNVFISAFAIVDNSHPLPSPQATQAAAGQPVLPTVGPTTSTLAHTTPMMPTTNVTTSTCVCPACPTD
ncbi:uncharacterized protein LOC118406345 [Branchiostoma floridae]|uniref:Uncharacterized protein LOC118406345 n=1 Tax=Branchiostoma floridae TaxID=7739 RepID=A0A9J7HMA4_BRAFL|nr:uncharacterized protein LOC118406345 [Branchiostoma floridae]